MEAPTQTQRAAIIERFESAGLNVYPSGGRLIVAKPLTGGCSLSWVGGTAKVEGMSFHSPVAEVVAILPEPWGQGEALDG